MEIKLSIIIVSYNTCSYILNCLTSIYTYPPKCEYEVIVVDNNSHDGSSELISAEFPDVKLIRNSINLGFSKANNLGAKVASGNFLFLLNSDTVVLENSLTNLVNIAEYNPSTCVVGPQLLNHDYTHQRSYFQFPTPLKTFMQITQITPLLYPLKNIKIIRKIFKNPPAFLIDEKEVASGANIDYFILAALLVRKKVYEDVGGLDENLFFYNEDSDLGYKLKQLKIEIKYLSESKIIHFGGSSSNVDNIVKNYLSYFRGALYVAAKHETILFLSLFRLALIIGSLIKIGISFFGIKSICPIGIYGNSSPIKLSTAILTRTYLEMVKIALFYKQQL